VLSMPGSAYYKIANQIAGWLSVVKEYKINSSTKTIVDSLTNTKLQNDDILVNFHFRSFVIAT